MKMSQIWKKIKKGFKEMRRRKNSEKHRISSYTAAMFVLPLLLQYTYLAMSYFYKHNKMVIGMVGVLSLYQYFWLFWILANQ